MTFKPAAVVAALCGLTIAGGAASQSAVPAQGTGIVAGQVIDETSKRPVGGAIVTLALAAGPGQAPIPAAQARRGVAVATSEGRFVFRDVPAGTFSLTATLNGYAPGATGRRRPGGPSGTFTLADSGRITDAVISMWRLSTISGTVRDDRGEPVIGIGVTAFRRGMTGDGPEWAYGGGEVSDDRGQFRVNGLAPGTYTVGITNHTLSNSASGVAAFRAATSAPDLTGSMPFRGITPEGAQSGIIRIVGTGLEIDGWQVTASSARLPPLPGPDDTVLIHSTAFFGNTPSPRHATPFTLAAGEDRAGVDLTLPLIAGVRVAGTLHSPTGPAAGHGLRLIQLTDAEGPNLTAPVAYTTSDPQGRFVFLGVPPGSYVVRAYRVQAYGETMARMSGAPVAPAGPPAPSLFADLPVTVGASHVDNLSLTLTPGAVLAGRVQFEGTTAAPTADQIGRISFGVRPVSATDEHRTRIEPAGTFKTPGHAAGRYLINVTPPPQGWVLASIRIGGVDAAGQAFTLGDDDVTDIVVTFTDRTMTLTGSVSAEDASALPEATVVVMPTDVRAWIASGMSPRRVATTYTSNGSYQVTIPLPGNYLVVAVPPDVDPEVDPEFAARFAASAVRVSIAPGETKTQPLTIRRPR